MAKGRPREKDRMKRKTGTDKVEKLSRDSTEQVEKKTCSNPHRPQPHRALFHFRCLFFALALASARPISKGLV